KYDFRNRSGHRSGPGVGEFTISNEREVLLLQKLPQFGRIQQLPLLIARIDESRARCAQVAVAISRMADQFPCSFRQGREALTEKGSINRAGLDHSHDAIGS